MTDTAPLTPVNQASGPSHLHGRFPPHRLPQPAQPGHGAFLTATRAPQPGEGGYLVNGQMNAGGSVHPALRPGAPGGGGFSRRGGHRGRGGFGPGTGPGSNGMTGRSLGQRSGPPHMDRNESSRGDQIQVSSNDRSLTSSSAGPSGDGPTSSGSHPVDSTGSKGQQGGQAGLSAQATSFLPNRPASHQAEPFGSSAGPQKCDVLNAGQPKRPIHSHAFDGPGVRKDHPNGRGVQNMENYGSITPVSATNLSVPQLPPSTSSLSTASGESANQMQGGDRAGRRGRGQGRGQARRQQDGRKRADQGGDSSAVDPAATQPDSSASSVRGSARTTDVDKDSVDGVTPNGNRGAAPNARNGKSKRKPRPPPTGDSAVKGVAQVPPPPKNSRRAAFDEQTKLTTTISRSSAGSGGREEEAQQRRTNGTRKRGADREPEKDDLVSRLTRGLGRKPFFECPICYNSILPAQPIWSCLPPDHPPAPPTTGNLQDPKQASNHYQACYTPFHLHCIKDWAKRNHEEDAQRLRLIESDEEPGWRCPGCQKRRCDPVGGYRCFCGRLSHPPSSTVAPHSCNEPCSRRRTNCDHACPLPCHPGPCPPCQVALIVPCPSHNTSLTVKCSAATSNNAALTPVCDEICTRTLSCGNRDHECSAPCHYGPCKPCDKKETVKCYCGHDSKEVACGWARQDEKLCVGLSDDGEETMWSGRYSCGRACDRLFDCGIHPCKETCHPHPVSPITCPFSPSQITTCPCGTTPLAVLPNYPRKDCLAPVPTCKSRCPKSRICGHLCPRTCHEGPCPPCHEEVVKPCRCGESMLVIGCDELRERAERGEGELTCERVCKALRSCGRHECGRMCCPLAYQAKNRGKKRTTDDMVADDNLHVCHLTCGKLLSCGMHTCPKPDHKGACGRCLQASYDELVCHCGHTVVYPPVACGTTINCIYPCARPPPTCGHPKTPHTCHEQEECPPCPYLASKPCACGKDPAVKHVRCSQDRVSCGQVCGELLSCGYHKCDKSCHRPGECDPCSQICNKPKRICRHPCTAACHAPARCPETDPCQAIITQACACGNLQSRSSCGASTTNPTSREVVQLKCNSECSIKQRNARLADALGIKVADRGQTEWSAELKAFAVANLPFVKMVEETFKEFFAGQRQTMILPHMPPVKRTFVMSLADAYHLGRELIDQEPNRSVQIRRRVDTRLPNPLLSASVPAPAAKPNLGALGNLRAQSAASAAWGKSTPASATTTPASTPPVSRTTSLQPLAVRTRTAQPQPTATVATTSAGTGPAASISLLSATMATQKPSRPATPVAPVLVEQKTKGRVGEVDDVDWDQSGDEA